MSFHFRTTLLDLARLAENLAWPAALRPRPAPSRTPEVLELAPHEWRRVAERPLPSHAPGCARVYRYRSPGDRAAG